MSIQKLAIYCGSAPGSDPAFADMARALVREMATRGIDMVYGGGRLGLMGIIADTMLEAGGKVYGVIPQALVDHEVAHTGLTELHTVANMHERKAKMTELCDGFVCLPGGIGTLDEMFEAWTWNALGYHAKPFCLLNVHGFWNDLADFEVERIDNRLATEQRVGLGDFLAQCSPGAVGIDPLFGWAPIPPPE